MTAPTFTPAEMARYNRHFILPEVGVEGQQKLKAAKVLIVGAGGLGCPVALYLAAAGVGTIGLVDFDKVDDSNLQRQVLYTTVDVGKSKVEQARQRILGLNPFISVITYEEPLTSENALGILEDYDIVVDGTDNFATRYLVNDACILLGKPNVYGSIFRFEGQVSIFCHPEGPSYRCLYPEPPPPGLVPSCAEGGVFGVLPGVVGCMQATEAIKLITGIGEPLIGRLIRFDALSMKFYELRVRRDPQWALGAPHPTVTSLIDYQEFCGVPKETEAMQDGRPYREISVRELKQRLDAGSEGYVLIDVRQPHEYQIASIPGAKLLPLTELQARFREIPSNVEVIIHCHHGRRSANACEFLATQGYSRLTNVAGGIDDWSLEIDPSVQRY